MKVLDIKNLSRKESFIYYRREFSGIAVMEMLKRNVQSKIEFVMEQSPTGKFDVNVQLKDAVDYPVLPVVQSLKDYIIGLDKKGMLP